MRYLWSAKMKIVQQTTSATRPTSSDVLGDELGVKIVARLLEVGDDPRIRWQMVFPIIFHSRQAGVFENI